MEREPESRLPLGAILMLLAVTIIPTTDALAKLLGQSYPVLQIIWMRYAFTTLLIAPVAFHQHRARLAAPQAVIPELLRAVSMVLANLAYFAAVQHLPLADALGIFFVYPLLTTLVSSKVLGERATLRTWVACLIGFVGILLITRPGFTANIGALYALLSSFAITINLVLTRKLSQTTPASVGLLYTAAVGWIGMSFFTAPVWQPPDGQAMVLFFVMAFAATACNWLMYSAFKYAPAATLAPLSYAEILSAAAFGYVLFGDVPDFMTIMGISLIAAGGVYLLVHQRSGKRQRLQC